MDHGKVIESYKPDSYNTTILLLSWPTQTESEPRWPSERGDGTHMSRIGLATGMRFDADVTLSMPVPFPSAVATVLPVDGTRSLASC